MRSNRTLLPRWQICKKVVLEKHPQARVVLSHGGRMVLLHPNDNPPVYDVSVSEAWRTAYKRRAGDARGE